MLTLKADVVLHADRHWRGQFGTGKAGHLTQLIASPAVNPLFCAVVAGNVSVELSGQASPTTATLVRELQGPIYPWEEKVVTLPLSFVGVLHHFQGRPTVPGWLPVGNERLALLQRKWLWMHIRLEQDSRDKWLVWLDEQLHHGRLLG